MPPRSPDTRASSAKRGYDARWRRIRDRYLRKHPICERLDCGEPATDVDHIDGSGPRGDNNDSNLEALCHPHHSAKTAKQDGGFGKKLPRKRSPERHPGLID